MSRVKNDPHHRENVLGKKRKEAGETTARGFYLLYKLRRVNSRLFIYFVKRRKKETNFRISVIIKESGRGERADLAL